MQEETLSHVPPGDSPEVPDPATQFSYASEKKVARPLASGEVRRYRNSIAKSLGLVVPKVTDPLDERVVKRSEKMVEFSNWTYSTGDPLMVEFIETHDFFGDPSKDGARIWDDKIVDRPSPITHEVGEKRPSAWATIPASAIRTIKKEELIAAARELGCDLPVSPEELTKEQLLSILKNA